MIGYPYGNCARRLLLSGFKPRQVHDVETTAK